MRSLRRNSVAACALAAASVTPSLPSWHHARRNTTHAFVRPPGMHSIPSTGPNGVVINRDMLLHQFRDFYKTLQQSTLIDRLHVMSELSTFESVRAGDAMINIGSSNIAMPLVGMEHRIGEFNETMRYIRASGGPSSPSPYLQDVDNCRCHASDIVQLPGGIAVGHGARTNIQAHQTLKGLYVFQEQYNSFDVFTLEQEGDAPPLADYFGFAGANVLLTWKDEHGMLAVDQYQRLKPDDTLQVVYLEPGCHFLTFFGADYTPDVLVQRGYDRSMESLANAGLNPIPVQWSELDKMGVSMRAAALVMKFAKPPPQGLMPRNKVRGSRWASHQITGGSQYN